MGHAIGDEPRRTDPRPILGARKPPAAGWAARGLAETNVTPQPLTLSGPGAIRPNRCLTWLAVAVLWIVAGLAAGCGSKVDTRGARELALKLPGAREVLRAADKNDYEGALARLLTVQQSVATTEQQAQFNSLVEELKIKLIEAAPDNPKAAQALASLRALSGGR